MIILSLLLGPAVSGGGGYVCVWPSLAGGVSLLPAWPEVLRGVECKTLNVELHRQVEGLRGGPVLFQCSGCILQWLG